MQQLMAGDDSHGLWSSPKPALPNLVSLDLKESLSRLHTYTNNLISLAAPNELCLQKAIELISYRQNFELNLEVFRMELLEQELGESGERDVNALVIGIRCLCEALLANFDNYLQSNENFFPYEFHLLHMDRYLFLSKIVFNDSLPAFQPTVIAKPAYTYPEVQAQTRADYSAKTDQCLVLHCNY